MQKLISSWRKLRLGKKLFVYWTTTGLVLITLTVLIFTLLGNESARKEMENGYRNQIALLNNQVVASIETLHMIIKNVANDVRLSELIAEKQLNNETRFQQEIHEITKGYYTYSPLPFYITLIDRQGNRLYNKSDKIPSFFDNIVQREIPNTAGTIVVAPNQYKDQSQLLLLRSAPDRSLFVNGIAALFVKSEDIQLHIDQLKFEKNQLVWLFDNKGRTITSTDMIEEERQQLGLSFTPGRSTDKLDQESIVQFRGESYYLTTTPMNELDYMLVVLTPVKEVLRDWEHASLYRAMAILILIIVWLFISFIIVKRIYAPLKLIVDRCGIPNTDQSDELLAISQYIEKLVSANNELQDQLTDYIPDLKLSTFQHLLWGELTEAELINKVEGLNLPLKGDLFYICIATIDEYGQFLAKYNKKDQLLIHNSLRKTSMVTYGQEMNCVSFTPHHGIIAILIGVDKQLDNADQAVRAKSEQFRVLVKENFAFTISIAISKARRGYSSMSMSYMEASSLLNYKMLLGNDMIVSDQDIEGFSRKPSRDIFQHTKQIVRAVIQGEMNEANDQLDELVKKIPLHTYKSETALGMFSYLLGELEYSLLEMDVNIHDIFPDDIFDTLYSKSTLVDVQDWLMNTVFTAVREQFDSQQISRQKRIIQQVNYSIHDLYDTDLSLQDAADELGISSSQLSRIYKEETGRTFSEYLIAYRMKKAMEFLENTDMQIKDIAEKLRYTNVQNFSRIFKQITGVPPGEYRKQSQELGLK